MTTRQEADASCNPNPDVIKLGHTGALILESGFGVHRTILIIRNPPPKK